MTPTLMAAQNVISTADWPALPQSFANRRPPQARELRHSVMGDRRQLVEQQFPERFFKAAKEAPRPEQPKAEPPETAREGARGGTQHREQKKAVQKLMGDLELA